FRTYSWWMKSSVARGLDQGLVLLPRHTVLEVQLRNGVDECESTNRDQPVVHEDDAEAEEGDGTGHGGRPDGTRGEESEGASLVGDLCLFPVLRKDVSATLGDVNVETEHHGQGCREHQRGGTDPLKTHDRSPVIDIHGSENVDHGSY